MFESEGLPLYLKIKNVILQRIIAFTYHDRLPGELLLANEFKVARGTIKQAIDALVISGMLYREQGKGTFINRAALHKHYTDLPDILVTFAAGQPMTSEVISLLPTMASEEIAACMGLALGSQLLRLERRVLLDDKVSGHILTYLNGNVYSDLSHIDGHSSLYTQLRETFGYSPTQTQESYQPVVCDATLARLLQSAPGHPVFRIERTASNMEDKVLEYSITHVLGARLSLQIAANQSMVEEHWSCSIQKKT